MARDEAVLLIRGQIAENEARMKALESDAMNAIQSMRGLLVLYTTPADIDMNRVRAAVARLDEVVAEYRTLDTVSKSLRERLG